MHFPATWIPLGSKSRGFQWVTKIGGTVPKVVALMLENVHFIHSDDWCVQYCVTVTPVHTSLFMFPTKHS